MHRSTTPSPRRTLGLALVAVVAAGLLAVPAGASAQATPAEGQGGGQPEIVGGVPVTDPGAYPYQMAVVRHDEPDGFLAQFCGGSLISPDTVLTAAHCVVDETAINLDVRSGILDLVDDVGHRSRVRQIRVHPQYDADTSDNDVAILQLVHPLPEAPVEVARPSQAGLWPAGTPATITGWGDLTGNNDYPTDLHVAQAPVVSDADCAAAYPTDFVAGHMLCAGDIQLGGVDTCQGDSGGPIVVDNAGSPLQIGVTSFGEGCALPGFPGVYARLDTYFGPFIERFLDPDGPPDAPRRVAAGSAYGAVRVMWRPPFFDGGTRITAYEVTLRPGGRVVSTPGSARAVNVSGLAPHRTYTVTVKAGNARGPGTTSTTSVRIP